MLRSRSALSSAPSGKATFVIHSRDGDTELADFFRKAQAESRKGAEQGKQMLKSGLSG
jgi:hypothetical protein